MSSDARGSGLLAQYLEAAAEEADAWKSLAQCDQAAQDYSPAFLRWSRARQASHDLELLWQAALRQPE